MWSIKRRTRQWAGNPTSGQVVTGMVITAVIFLLVMLLLDIGGFIAHGVSYPLAAVLIIGYNVVQAYVIRLVARRRH